jgi:pterin-4a-carbinolamine dehydratase
VITVPTRRPSYEPLDDAALAEALALLPGWHGDTSRIMRTVQPADLWTLLERIADAEAELDHHTVVDLERGTATFVVWSHVCDAVTDADITLAQRINDAIDV